MPGVNRNATRLPTLFLFTCVQDLPYAAVGSVSGTHPAFSDANIQEEGP